MAERSAEYQESEQRLAQAIEDMRKRRQRIYNQQVEEMRAAEAEDKKDWGSKGVRGAGLGSVAGPWGALAGGIAGSFYGQTQAMEQRNKENKALQAQGKGGKFLGIGGKTGAGMRSFYDTFVNPREAISQPIMGIMKNPEAAVATGGTIGRKLESKATLKKTPGGGAQEGRDEYLRRRERMKFGEGVSPEEYDYWKRSQTYGDYPGRGNGSGSSMA